MCFPIRDREQELSLSLIWLRQIYGQGTQHISRAIPPRIKKKAHPVWFC